MSSLGDWFSEQWDKVEAAAETALPALKAEGANYLIDLLEKEKNKAQQELEIQIKNGLNSPNTVNSAVKDSLISAIISQYGIYIVMAVIAIAFLIMYKR